MSGGAVLARREEGHALSLDRFAQPLAHPLGRFDALLFRSGSNRGRQIGLDPKAHRGGEFHRRRLAIHGS
jgi:hypothetical protein